MGQGLAKIWEILKAFWARPTTKVVASLVVAGGIAKITGLSTSLVRAASIVGHSAVGPYVIPALVLWVVFSPFFIIYALKRILEATTSPAAAFLDSAKELCDIADRCPYRLEAYEWNMVVRADYGMEHRTTRTMAAVDRPVFALSQSRGSSNSPISDLTALKFQAKWADGGGSVTSLPAIDTPTQREFIVCFDPALEPGKPARRLLISHVWPTSGKKLKSKNVWDHNTWVISSQMVGPVGKVTVSLKFS